MKILIYSLLFLLLFIPTITYAETLSSDSLVYDATGKSVILTLYKDTKVECGKAINGMQSIFFTVSVPGSSYFEKLENNYIKPATILSDEQGNIVGETTADVLLLDSSIILVHGEKKLVADVVASIPSTSINEQTVVEVSLRELVKNHAIKLTAEKISETLSPYSFQLWSSKPPFSAWSIMEPDFLSKNPCPRVILVFYKEELIALFHSRPLDADLFQTQESCPRGLTLSWRKRLSKEEIQLFEQSFSSLIPVKVK
jgi:hypothetical protein